MDNLTDFDNTKDVSDAEIEWVLRETGATYFDIAGIRRGACFGYPADCARILAARLIQSHHPELLVDPDLPEAREIVARVICGSGASWLGGELREGKCDEHKSMQIAIAAIKRGRQLEQMK